LSEKTILTTDLFEEDHVRLVVARIQALFEAMDSNPPEGVRRCDVKNNKFSN